MTVKRYTHTSTAWNVASELKSGSVHLGKMLSFFKTARTSRESRNTRESGTPEYSPTLTKPTWTLGI